MTELAAKTSEALEQRYVTVELQIRAHQGRVWAVWKGYTEVHGHKERYTLEDVALSILPPTSELRGKAAELRAEAEKLEQLATTISEGKK